MAIVPGITEDMRNLDGEAFLKTEVGAFAMKNIVIVLVRLNREIKEYDDPLDDQVKLRLGAIMKILNKVKSDFGIWGLLLATKGVKDILGSAGFIHDDIVSDLHKAGCKQMTQAGDCYRYKKK